MINLLRAKNPLGKTKIVRKGLTVDNTPAGPKQQWECGEPELGPMWSEGTQGTVDKGPWHPCPTENINSIQQNHFREIHDNRSLIRDLYRTTDHLDIAWLRCEKRKSLTKRVGVKKALTEWTAIKPWESRVLSNDTTNDVLCVYF